MQTNKLVVLCLIVLSFASTVSADSSYCTPPTGQNVVIDHQGNWFNITIRSETCMDWESDNYGDIFGSVCSLPPVVSFTSNTTCGDSPLTVQFNDTSLHDPYAWTWDFGEGNTSNEQNPIHTFPSIGAYNVNLTATNIIGTSHKSVSKYITVIPDWATCNAPTVVNTAPSTGTGGVTSIPLQTEMIQVPFLAIPLFCMFYVFRRKDDDLSHWGDVAAAGLGLVISAMVAMWFIQGGITSVPVTLENSSYQIPGTMSIADANLIQENSAKHVAILGTRGTGMSITSAMSTAEYSTGTMVTVHTHDIIIQRYQDTGLMLLYMLLAVLLAALLVVSILRMRDQKSAEDDYDNDPQNFGG